MTLGEFARIVGNLRGVTKYLYLHVLGEPLTHPMLPTFIEYATGCGFKVAITTNGTLLDKRGDDIIKAGVYKVNVSLHSFEGKDTAQQERYVRSCVDFAQRSSHASVLTVLRLWNRNSEEEILNEKTVELIKGHFGDTWTLGARGARIHDKLHLEYGDRFEWPDINKEEIGDRVFCHGLRDHFAILVDGSVIPCCLDAEGDIILGNIFKEDIRSILSSDRALSIKEGFESKRAVEELCKKCSYSRRFKV